MAECNKIVSDIFGKFEFLMKYQNMGSYAHFAPFLKVIILYNIVVNFNSFSQAIKENSRGIFVSHPRSLLQRKIRKRS